ncbi:ORF138 [Staphylococcus phage 187]|uniref:ORF138 n=1 Tax=Staphylococcus phage 187 TaxID=2908096 RepID=Q4ZE14_9CAUD|nr:ORF138 [Staphylococcus phage 187]AAX90752.1 ORF138 [Staphylococcus phage 187]
MLLVCEMNTGMVIKNYKNHTRNSKTNKKKLLMKTLNKLKF